MPPRQSRRINPNRPIVAEAAYLKDLIRVVNHAVNHAKPLLSSVDKIYERLDTEEEAIDYFYDEFKQMVRTFKYLKVPVENYAKQVSDFNKKSIYDKAQQFGISLASLRKSEKGIDKKLDGWAAVNVDLIKTISDVYFDDIRLQVTAALLNGVRAETLAKRLQEREDIPKNRAVLIARDQIGKLNSDLLEQRNINLGIKRYIWRTVNDNRVRPEHSDREGQYFDWASPPSGGHPGQDIQCRCYAEPDFSPIQP